MGVSEICRPCRPRLQNTVDKSRRCVLQDTNSSTESDISLTNICEDNVDDDFDDTGISILICSKFEHIYKMWHRCAQRTVDSYRLHGMELARWIRVRQLLMRGIVFLTLVVLQADDNWLVCQDNCGHIFFLNFTAKV